MTTETFKLSQPLKTHNGDVTELTIKTPRGRAFVEYGEPFQLKPRLNEEGEATGVEFVFNNKSMIRFMSDMTGIDDLLLGDIPAPDFFRLRSTAANMIIVEVPDKNPTERSDA